MTQQLLQQLVEMRGIETQYVDAWGKPATIAESSKANCLTHLAMTPAVMKKFCHKLHKI